MFALNALKFVKFPPITILIVPENKTVWDVTQTILALLGGGYALLKLVFSDVRRWLEHPKLRFSFRQR
jgi:hypothetical protein